jgi:hypothetical protein
VQSVIEGERTEATYAPRYLGAYDDRYIEPGDLNALTALADRQPWDRDRLAQTQAALFGAELARWIQEHRQRSQEERALAGVPPGVDFEFRGQKYPAGEARRLRNQVRRELEKDDLRWAELDRNVFLVHYHASRSLDRKVTEELVERYRFHLTVQKILKDLSGDHDRVGSALQYLLGVTELTRDEYRDIVVGARIAHGTLCQSLALANGVSLPELKHVRAGKSLGEFLLRQGTVADFRLEEKALRPKHLFRSLAQLERQLGEMRERVRRVHFKSLGGILALQESIWKTAHEANKPAPLPG